MSKLKQAFYENHSGSSITEINRITAVILTGHLLYTVLSKAGWTETRLDKYAWGFVCYIFNVLLAMTVYSSHHVQLLILYIVPAILTCFLQWYAYPRTQQVQARNKPKLDKMTRSSPKESKPKINFLSVYRATMMITTIIAILAVDLPVFPRRYAKTETWGTSLMDLGVGSFVFSSGVVSSVHNLSVLQGLKQGGIVLLMGIARALMVRGTGYHEHVSEYGVHWNFFITLSLLPPLLPLFRRMRNLGIQYMQQGVVVGLVYQYILVQTGWQNWILGAYRDSLISANKEGISSFVGYTVIFLFGLDAGSIILAKKQKPVVTLLSLSSLAFIFGYLFVKSYFNYRVSRRIANAPYILWVAAHNTSFLAALAVVDRVPQKFAKLNVSGAAQIITPLILEKINSRGIYVFLGANLLTGAINLIMGDAMISMADQPALLILVLYGLLVSGITFVS